jgi:FkbM family methyltransferase
MLNDPKELARLVVATNGRHGCLLHLTNDGYIGRSLEAYGEFSEAEVRLWRRYITPGDLVLDIGANIGAHTIALARLVGPQGIVLAFEPIRFLYHLCCGNVALNGLTNVRAYHYAVGAQAGRLTVPLIDFVQPGTFGGLPLGAWEQGEPVSVISLDELLSVPACHFIKVDVEGMELDVLQGAEQTITRFRPVLYVEHDDTDKGRMVLKLLQAWDYRLYWHRPPLFDPHNFFRNPVDVFAGQYMGMIHNVLAVPATRLQPEDLEGVA